MAASSARKLHALAVPLPAQGHLNPLMRFCETLTSPPHHHHHHAAFDSITFLNIDAIHHRLAHGLRQKKQQDESHLRSNVIRQACVPLAGFTFENLWQNTIRDTVEALDGLVPYIEEFVHELNHGDSPVCFLISDLLMTGPTQVVADNLGIPRIAFFASSARMLLLLDYMLEGVLPMNEVLDVLKNQEVADTFVFKSGLPGLPSLTKGNLPHTPSLEDHPDDEDRCIYQTHIQWLSACKERAHCIAVNSSEEFEPHAFVALRERLNIPVYAVGPLKGNISTTLWKEDDECLKWLDKQPSQSVIYITSGSLTSYSPKQCDELCAALLASGQRFLWVFRTEGFMYQDTGASNASLSAEFFTQTCEQGRVVGWAPQIQVLSHRAIAAYVSHCGWNSTLEAVTNGVPLLCVPSFYDQFLDAELVVEVWKSGVRLATRGRDGIVDREEFQRAFKSVMMEEESKALRDNATKLRDNAYRALLPGGSTYDNIQSFLQGLPLPQC